MLKTWTEQAKIEEKGVSYELRLLSKGLGSQSFRNKEQDRLDVDKPSEDVSEFHQKQR